MPNIETENEITFIISISIRYEPTLYIIALISNNPLLLSEANRENYQVKYLQRQLRKYKNKKKIIAITV